MKKFISRLTPDDFVHAQQYRASASEMPPGVKARTTSRGAEAVVQRPDGIVFHASEGDWIVQINDEPMIVLNEPCFRALFKGEEK